MENDDDDVNIDNIANNPNFIVASFSSSKSNFIIISRIIYLSR